MDDPSNKKPFDLEAAVAEMNRLLAEANEMISKLRVRMGMDEAPNPTQPGETPPCRGN